MARFITIASGKGGVGKTTLTVNLATALGRLGKDVTVIDANITTPHIGLHIGVPHEKSLNDYLRGEARFEEILYYNPLGFKVIPAALSLDALSGVDFTRAEELKQNFSEDQIVLIDSAPCFGKEGLAAIKMGDEVIFVTTPYNLSVQDASKGALIARMLNKKLIGLVINMEAGKKHEMRLEEIGSITNMQIIGRLQSDENHLKGLAIKAPLVMLNDRLYNSKEYMRIAAYICGADNLKNMAVPKKKGFLDSLIFWR